jgi:cytidylate kinase
VQRRELVVAVDGPSGSGKSTVSRAVATAAGLRYLDTGAMYRAAAWLALREGVNATETDRIAALVAAAPLEIRADPSAPTIHIDGVDVTDAVRGAEVTAAVSAVSAVPGVRQVMVRHQRELIGAGGIVVEGRDIGTAVAPNAPVKIFLTADPSVRALRRSRQDGVGTGHLAVATTEAALNSRDDADSRRVASPLTQAPDAIVLDSTRLGVDEIVREVRARIEAVERA